MGCGAIRGLGTVTKVSEVNQTSLAKTRATPEPTENVNTNASSAGSSIPEDEATNCNSISPSPSMHSCLTSGPSLHSSMTARDRHVFKGLSLCDDLKSDVPTIAESIADMQDFADLPVSNHGLHSARSTMSYGSSGSKESPGFFLDTRMHPLAVVCSSEKSDSQCCTVGDRDLGGCSDVPSIRDDASVASAPSEICMSFPVQTCRSETTNLSGSSTPNNRTLSSHKSRSAANSRGLRRLHENHRKEHLFNHLDDAMARLHLTKPSRSPSEKDGTESLPSSKIAQKTSLKTGPTLANTANKVSALGRRWSAEQVL